MFWIDHKSLFFKFKSKWGVSLIKTKGPPALCDREEAKLLQTLDIIITIRCVPSTIVENFWTGQLYLHI